MRPKMGKTRRGSGEQVREKIRALERRLTALEAHLQRLRRRSMGQISQVLAASRKRVEQDTARLGRALRAGMKAGTEAYRRPRKS